DTATALGQGPGKSVADLDSRVRKHQRTEWLGFPMEMPEDLRAEGFTVDRQIESERDAIEWVKTAVERFTES
ncbi:MAG: hypothetical protein ACK5R1_12820, partial [Planctomycetota bacterium]